MPSGTFSVGVDITPKTMPAVFRPVRRPATLVARGARLVLEVVLLEDAAGKRGSIRVARRLDRRLLVGGEHPHDLIGIDLGAGGLR